MFIFLSVLHLVGPKDLSDEFKLLGNGQRAQLSLHCHGITMAAQETVVSQLRQHISNE